MMAKAQLCILALMFAGCETLKVPGDDGSVSGDTGASRADDTGGQDADGDGFDDSVDCDDSNASIHPDAEEVCDTVDNNCDGQIDEGLTLAYFPDGDDDGYGSDADKIESCDVIEGMLTVGGDCDDANDQIHPLGIELCDGVDNNCDGSTDGEDAADKTFWFPDADGDGFGVIDDFIFTCYMPEGFADNEDDCDDLDVAVHPGATEVCDGVDNSCDGQVDPASAEAAPTWFRDADSDTFGNADVSEVACAMPSGFVADGNDCDDTNPLVNPDGTEVCDGVDQNCDGTIDEGFDASPYFHDYDGDGYGDPLDAVVHCVRPAGFVSDATDCDDDDYWRNPGLPELCDGKDNDCDEVIDEELVDSDYYPDADGDGYGNPDGLVVTDCIPPPGYVFDATDCDDARASINPGEIESCNGIDDDCDSDVDEGLAALSFYLDADGDGYGVPETTTEACAAPDGFSALSTDCDDAIDSTHPGAYEFCDEVDNDCDEVVDDDCGSSVILGTYEGAVCEHVDGNIEQEGDRIRVNWNEMGTWCNSSSNGFEVGDGEGDYHEAVYPGSPWQVFVVEWSTDSSSYSHTGNYSGSSWTYDTDCAGILGDDETVAGAIHEYMMDGLSITKTEIWEVEGSVSRVWFDVVNDSGEDVSDFDLMWAVDWDQDVGDHGTYNTLNDTNDDGDFDGIDGGRLAISEGPTSGRAIIFGVCDGADQVVGHTAWDTDDDATLVDDDGASGDRTAHWVQRDLSIGDGDSASFGFLITVGEDVEEAVDAYLDQVDVLCTD